MSFRIIYIILLFFFLKNTVLFSQTIAVIGDFENTPVQVDSVSMLVKSWNPDLVVTSGDNFDLSTDTVDEQVGKYYSDFIYPYHGNYGSGGITNKFYPAIGNHELVLNGLLAFLSYYTLPGNERYYTVQRGNVVFFILNSNPSEQDGVSDTSAQAVWLKNQLDLAGNNWKVVVFHHPPYTSGPHPSTTYMQWPFEAWGADAVISGHNHFYERLYSNGVEYFVNGTGGAALYSYSTLIPESQFIYNKSWGALKVQPYPDSLVFRFYNIRDSLVDKYVIYRITTGINNITEVQTDPDQNNIEINFNLEVKEPLKIEIFDMEGRLISLDENIFPVNKSCFVNIATLKNGMYLIHADGQSINASSKFVVMR
jgi:tartrate-resistant acid phosphatase type 5